MISTKLFTAYPNGNCALSVSRRHTKFSTARLLQRPMATTLHSVSNRSPTRSHRSYQLSSTRTSTPRFYSISKSPTTLLNILRSRSKVDCDTLDASIVSSLGPFEDCTSNQAITFFELRQPKHQALLQNAANIAKDLSSTFSDVPIEVLVVEIATISLALRIVPHLNGYIHIQVNPFSSFSTARTLADASRIKSLFHHLDPEFDTNRVCIKIPSTWEGLLACQRLESDGTKTLATTLFTLEQAALAAEVGCRYIAPYINELRVHLDPTYHDPSPLLALPFLAQTYYSSHGLPTQVLPASLTSVEEVMALAGAHHITISPGLLLELADVTVAAPEDAALPAGRFPSLFDRPDHSAFPSSGSGSAAVIAAIRRLRATESSSSIPDEEIITFRSHGDGEVRFKMAVLRSRESGSRVGVGVGDGDGDGGDAFASAATSIDGNHDGRDYERGDGIRKLVQALNIFCDMQLRLEDLMRPFL